MKQKNLTVAQQVDELGIDRNLFYDVAGSIENLKVLFFVIGEYLEDLEGGFKRLNPAPYLNDILKRIVQLSYIVENETKLAEKAIDQLLNQVEE